MTQLLGDAGRLPTEPAGTHPPPIPLAGTEPASPSHGPRGLDLRVVGDQILSSASNVLVLVTGALWLSPAGFATFALLQLLVIGCVTTQRAILLEPSMTVRRGDPELSLRLRWLFVSALLGGILCGLTGALLGLGGDGVDALVGLCAAVILLQDAGRYLAFSSGLIRHAVAADAMWTGVGIVALLARPDTPGALLVWWTGGALLSLTALVPCFRRRSRLIEWAQLRSLSVWSTLEAVLAVVVVSLPLFVGSLVEGQHTAGGYRLLQTLAGPLNVAHTSITVVLLRHAPEFMDRRGLDALKRRVPVVGAAFAIAAFAYICLAGTAISPVLTGAARSGTLLVPVLAVALVTASGAWTSPRLGGMKALGLQRRTVLPRLVSLVAMILASVAVVLAGFRIDGDATAPILFVYAASNGLVWHWTWRRSLRRQLELLPDGP